MAVFASSGSKDGVRVGLYVAVNGGQWWQRGTVSGGQRGLWRATGVGDEGGASGFVAHNVRFASRVMVYISKLQRTGEDRL